MDKCYNRGIVMKFDSPFDDLHPRSYRISTADLFSDISVLEVGYNRTPAGLRQTLKRDVYIIHYVTKGKGTFLDNNFDNNNGYMVVPHEREVVESDLESPYEAYWIMFRGDSADSILKKCALPEHNGIFKFDKCKECAKILKRVLFEIEPTNIYEEASIMQSAFYEIIALHLQDKKELTAASAAAQKIMEYISENYNKEICISELAREINFTRNYLYTLFKKEYNMSPQEYLMTLRIEKANQLLWDRTQNLSIYEIASLVGFNDALYFSKIFRKKTGLSPSKFRNI